MKRRLPTPVRLAITLGDPAGIGPEIAARAWAGLSRRDRVSAIFVGARQPFDAACQTLGVVPPPSLSDSLLEDPDRTNSAILDIPITAPLVAGQPDTGHAHSVITSIEKAVEFARKGQVNAIVTCPLAKSTLMDAGFDFPGHTEFLAHLTADMAIDGPRGPMMMLANAHLKVGLATIHRPLREVPGAITTPKLTAALNLLDHALRVDFGLERPRIHVTGLNPHAGEQGKLGHEDTEIIRPAIEAARAQGLNAEGPFPADTLFHEEARMGYEAVLAMYHDQGLIPVKTLDFHGGVNITLGLPVVRTSPDHGTAFDIAGRGLARADSLIAAMAQAAAIARRRAGDAD